MECRRILLFPTQLVESIVALPKNACCNGFGEVRGRSGESMQPKVTIILPVYNVEPYLRQCLDSVVNQTMQDIQIICVNDGSTDNSPAILEEYATSDSRVQVIHQANQGSGPARNAGYLHVRGKYTYFVDPDDWIEFDLCQQCWDRAEATGADIVTLCFVMHDPHPLPSKPFDPTLPEIRQTPEERYEQCHKSWTWLKFWRSDFLLSNNIRFAEGRRPYEDTLPGWKGAVLANYIAVLDKPLYHYRIRPNSQIQVVSEKHFIIVETFNEIEAMLHETGLYESYKDLYLAARLDIFFNIYFFQLLSPLLRSKFLAHIRQYRTEEERVFYRTAPVEFVPRHVRAFHAMIDGGTMARVSYYVDLAVYIVAKTVKMPKRRLFQKIVQRIKSKLGCNTKK